MLPGRLAALCATPAAAPRADRAHVAGARARARRDRRHRAAHAGGEALATRLADHLRALLRDVICGHLDVDLVALADEILLRAEHPRTDQVHEGASAKEMFGDACEAEEVLDLFI